MLGRASVQVLLYLLRRCCKSCAGISTNFMDYFPEHPGFLTSSVPQAENDLDFDNCRWSHLQAHGLERAYQRRVDAHCKQIEHNQAMS